MAVLSPGAIWHLDTDQSTFRVRVAAVWVVWENVVTRAGVLARNATASSLEQAVLEGTRSPDVREILANDCPFTNCALEARLVTERADVTEAILNVSVCSDAVVVDCEATTDASAPKLWMDGATTGWMKPAPLGQIFPLSIPYDPIVEVVALVKQRPDTMVDGVDGAPGVAHEPVPAV
jgi:hypothetical protein